MFHQILQYPIEEVLLELDIRKEEGLVYEQTDGDLSLFCHSKECAFKKAWDDFTTSSRGLIIDRSKNKIVALPFQKFFNFGEITYQLPDEPFEVFDKLDGSLGIVFYYNDRWRVATKGSFNSEQAQWAEKWLNQKERTIVLDPDFTYLCEIIYRDNKIVVDYDFEGLVLLAAYNNSTGEEMPYDLGVEPRDEDGIPMWPCAGLDLINTVDGHPDWRLTERFSYSSVDELVAVAKKLSHQTEGFVVRFENGYRVKIKSDEYVRIHRIVSDITPLGVWRLLINKQGWDDTLFKQELPEEILADYENIRNILAAHCEEIYNKALNAWRSIHKIPEARIDNNHFVKEMIRHKFGEPKNWAEHGIVPHITIAINRGEPEQKIRAKIFRHVRPTNNILEGYTPSSIMDRFQDET